jgi:minor extracellular serine protease Vpr
MSLPPRSLLLCIALSSACASGLDGSANADDIQLQTPRAKLAVKRVTARGDGSLKISQAPRFEQSMTVVLKLSGDPVAVVRSRVPGKQIAAADKQGIESALGAQQAALISTIEAQGGTVLATFQNAINGIKVQAPADKIAAFASLPGVVEVKRVAVHKRLNAISVPFIGAPQVWDGRAGFRGEHIKVAIIDTGIDFTHANFGGPGTPDAYNTAFKGDALPADPALFGPNAPKVKGGIDLVGDDYDPSNPKAGPVPDPNPLDCGAHGSHVAGTVAGFGVLADGTTYKGSYDLKTSSQTFAIGPGVAPLADLYAVRVFGCSGSTNVVVDALDWAVKNNMDVVNMSLGSPFGAEDDADAEASENAAQAGIIVVAAAGNEGPGQYITGSPGAGDKTISVAAMNSNDPKSFPGVNVTLTPGGAAVAQNSNNAKFNGTPLAVYVLPDGSGGVSLGCNEAEYVDAQIAGKLVVTRRGTCARILRAQLGFKHGAAAVAMINNGDGYPVFEGDIATLDGSGVVTIPFLGFLKTTTLASASTVSLDSVAAIANPLWHAFADFSSGGPRSADGHLKPDLSAPGVNIVSTAMGTGNQGVAFSGTSMATPHVAGVAALALEAHPGWEPEDVRTAILNTSDASQIVGYGVRLGGAGLVQPYPASRSSVIAFDQAGGAANLSFGVEEFTSDFSGTKTILVRNLGRSDVSFTVAAALASGSPSTVSVQPAHLTVEAGSSREVSVSLTIPAATAGDSSDFRDVAGLIVFTPRKGQNGDAALTVPYYVVARARAELRTQLAGDFGPAKPKATAKVTNASRTLAGTADFYAWGLAGTNAKAGQVGIRAVGVQANAVGTDQFLFFAINTFKPWSNNAENEFDLLIDTNGDGQPDFAVIAADLGSLTTGTPVGQMVTAVLNLNNPAASPGIQYPVTTPTDGSTMLIPVFASDIGVTAAAPRFAYSVQSFSGTGATDVAAGPAKFNAFSNAVSTASFVQLAAGQHASVPMVIDPVEWAQTPALGVMVVGLENLNRSQARLFGIGRPGDGQ